MAKVYKTYSEYTNKELKALGFNTYDIKVLGNNRALYETYEAEYRSAGRREGTGVKLARFDKNTVAKLIKQGESVADIKKDIRAANKALKANVKTLQTTGHTSKFVEVWENGPKQANILMEEWTKMDNRQRANELKREIRLLTGDETIGIYDIEELTQRLKSARNGTYDQDYRGWREAQMQAHENGAPEWVDYRTGRK